MKKSSIWTYDEIVDFIKSKTIWLPEGSTPITRDEYYKVVDDFQSILINNPPKGLL